MHGDWFFGYGSLVNRLTHAYPQARPARLRGWQRVWRPTNLRPDAFLSVRPAPGTDILGLVAAVPGADWAALDARETGYRRHAVSEAVEHDLPVRAEVQVYAVPGWDSPAPEDGHVLLSYLDVVVQGFLHQFGEDGAAHFFATTGGWPPSVLDDRAAPRYPRHQTLAPGERALVDRHLADLALRVIGPD